MSVLLTTRNGAAWIRQSLDSVFAQGFRDFELVVVDDASEDETPALLAGIVDPRLRVLRQERALGIAESRNAGFAACRGAYVAVLDHDDVSLPGRLEAQLGYLERHAEAVLVGTAVGILHGDRPSASGQPASVGAAGLRFLLHLGNALTWSSVMFRRAALLAVATEGRVLDRAFEPADDFELYHRLMRVGAVARLDDVLTQYRWHAGNTTHRTAAVIDERAGAVLAGAYERLGLAEAAAAAGLAIRHLSNRAGVPDGATLDQVLGVIDRVARACGDPEGLAGTMRWSVLRAAVRGGRPLLLLGRRRSWGPSADVLLSAGLGSIRAAMGRLLARDHR